jgi:hypothetical protein
MADNKEYRATHDEKNGVLKELARLEQAWREESDRELQLRFNARSEKVKSDPRYKACLKKYLAGQAMLDSAQKDAAKLGGKICTGYNSGTYIDSDGTGDQILREQSREALGRRLGKLSELRSRINLANLRSEVKALDAEARSL